MMKLTGVTRDRNVATAALGGWFFGGFIFVIVFSITGSIGIGLLFGVLFGLLAGLAVLEVLETPRGQ